MKRFIVYGLWFMVLSLFTIYYLPYTNPAYAQSPASLPLTLSPLPSSVAPTSPLYTDLILHNMFHSLSCLGIGQSIIGAPCLTYLQGVPVLSSVNTSGGLLGTTGYLIGALYANPPIRTASYLASLKEGLGIVKVANAQVSGSGAGVLDPILKLWQVSRNIAYLVMIIIFVIIGIMVMFKQRINPQTVITAQAALPGLVIGLIMITFSYFLAALLTDLAFVGTNIVGAYFSAAQGASPGNLSDTLKSQNTLSIMSTFVNGINRGGLSDAVGSVISQLKGDASWIVSTVAGFLTYQYSYQFAEVPATIISGAACGLTGGAAVFNPFAYFFGTAPTAALSVPECIVNATTIAKTAIATFAAAAAFASPATPISWALYFILIAVLIYTMLRLLLKLVNNFLAIIFYTITAPFHFLAASLPGRQGIATGWILNMLCNILVFPSVIAVFYFVNFLLGSGVKTEFPIAGGPLDLTGKGALPLFGGMDTNFIRLILAYGTLIALPTIPDIICRAIGRMGEAGQMLGQQIESGFGRGQGYAGQAHGSLGQIAGGLDDKAGWEYDDRTHTWKRSYAAIHGAKAGFISQVRGALKR